MRYLPRLFENNRRWASSARFDDPEYFTRRSGAQAPEHLWIGCADSRVPANEIVALEPGELFVHRNVANVVRPDDLNVLSVLHFAVETLQVRHIIVCGHYGCGGVQAALTGQVSGPLARWLAPIVSVRDRHRDELAALPDDATRWDRLCELNVATQVRAVTVSPPVTAAWAQHREVIVHGWIYDLRDGLLHDLELSRAGTEDAPIAQRDR